MKLTLVLALATVALPSLAAADPGADPVDQLTAAADPPLAPNAIGVRIGGYGFRRNADTIWNECRMDGLGLFADHALRGPWFVEAGLDFYFHEDLPLPAPTGDLPIDRMSGLASAAIGVQSAFTRHIRGYAQVGGGLELTRVSVAYGDTGGSATIDANKAMPEGFFGVGGDLRVGDATYLGAGLRVLVMGNFDYDPKQLMSTTWTAPPLPSAVFAATPDLALQAQFYVRRAI